MVPWVHPLEECDGTSQRKERGGTENTTLLQLFKPCRVLSHTILCIPPKEGLLEVGRGYNPCFTGEELKFGKSVSLNISQLTRRFRTQSQVFSLLCVCVCVCVPFPSYPTDLITQPGFIPTCLYFLLYTLFQIMRRKRRILKLELVGGLYLGSTGLQEIWQLFSLPVSILTYRKSSSNLTLLYSVAIL